MGLERRMDRLVGGYGVRVVSRWRLPIVTIARAVLVLTPPEI